MFTSLVLVVINLHNTVTFNENEDIEVEENHDILELDNLKSPVVKYEIIEDVE